MEISLKNAIQTGLNMGNLYKMHNPINCGSGAQGQYRGAKVGQSLDYRDYKDYQTGDDLRSIDWAVYARSDKLVIKNYQEELSPHLDLIVDTSTSMTIAEDKEAMTYALVAFFILIAEKAKFSITVWKCSKFGMIKLAKGEEHSLKEHLNFEESLSLSQAWFLNAPILKPRSMRLVVSDLLFDAEPLALILQILRGASSTGIFQILSSQDLDPDFSSFVEIEEIETGKKRKLFYDQSAQQRYQQNLQCHQELWFKACLQCGIPLLEVNPQNYFQDVFFQKMIRDGFLVQG